jgi:phospholipase/carboxylesterase
MSKYQEPKFLELDGWPFRSREPENPTDHSPILLLLHGHLGNEKSMWPLAHPITTDYYFLAPRAPMKKGEDQYSWHEITPQWPDLIETYQPLAQELLNRVNLWQQQNQSQVAQYDVMGFSQGASMAYALLMLFPQKIRRIAAIAGFIPQSWKRELENASLQGKKILISHGKNDDVVPIQKARLTAELLRINHAQVTFCESDAGHKLDSKCFNGLGEFFNT